MKSTGEPTVITQLKSMNEYGADDLFICCAGFEARCSSAASRLSPSYRTRYSIILQIEDSFFTKEVEANHARLQAALWQHTVEGVYVINCNRDNPNDAIAQIKAIWPRVKPKDVEEPYITLDISGITKIYLLQLLYFIVAEQSLGLPRLVHTTQSYAATRLTRGVEQITTIPNFFGSMTIDKPNLLILLLGFEPERSLSVWKQFNSEHTIALISNPPRDGNMYYLEYAKKNNAALLSQANVELRDVPPDSPYGVRNTLEEIYHEYKDTHNIIVGPFGTKPQTVGVFLFCLEHPKVQVIYSFPSSYTHSYLQREPGDTLLLPLNPPLGRDASASSSDADDSGVNDLA